MSTLRDHIVRKLTNSFIVSGIVDATVLAREMQKEYRGVEELELVTTIKNVAADIGVRIKEQRNGKLEPEADCDACL